MSNINPEFVNIPFDAGFSRDGLSETGVVTGQRREPSSAPRRVELVLATGTVIACGAAEAVRRIPSMVEKLYQYASERPLLVTVGAAAVVTVIGVAGLTYAPSDYRPMTRDERLYYDASYILTNRRVVAARQELYDYYYSPSPPTPTPVIEPLPNTGNLPSAK